MLKTVYKASVLVQDVKSIPIRVMCRLATRSDQIKGNEFKRYTPESFTYGYYPNMYLANDRLVLYYVSVAEFLKSFNRRAKQTISMDFKAEDIKGFTENESMVFVDHLKAVEAHWRKKGFKTKLKILSKYEALPNFRLTISSRENFK